MKRILILLSVVVIALTFGSAYAAEKDMSAGDYNGITAFEAVPLPSHDLGAGLSLENGITAFDVRPVEYSEEGSAAGGMSTTTMEPSIEFQNGITVF